MLCYDVYNDDCNEKYLCHLKNQLFTSPARHSEKSHHHLQDLWCFVDPVAVVLAIIILMQTMMIMKRMMRIVITIVIYIIIALISIIIFIIKSLTYTCLRKVHRDEETDGRVSI